MVATTTAASLLNKGSGSTLIADQCTGNRINHTPVKITQTLLGCVQVASIFQLMQKMTGGSNHELVGKPHAQCVTGIYDRADGSLVLLSNKCSDIHILTKI